MLTSHQHLCLLRGFADFTRSESHCARTEPGLPDGPQWRGQEHDPQIDCRSVQADTGSIKLSDAELLRFGPDRRARLGLGYVPQGRDIFPHLTVWENLRASLVAQNVKANGNVDRVLELFPVLKEMLQRKGGVLSGGQQQQLAIARALLTNPKVLMLDEPTEGIQPNIIDQIAETLLKIKKEGNISILLVEQYLDFCLAVGDRFYIMDRGAIVVDGPISNLNETIVREHLTV